MKGLLILAAFSASCIGGVAAAQPMSPVCRALERKLEQRPALEGRAVDEALFEAASLDCAEMAADLLARGASVKARDGRGASALSIAAGKGAGVVAGLLLEAGADLSHRDLSGATPLFRAAKEGRRRVAEMLLKAGADPDAADNYGATPLIAASFGGHRRLVSMLIEAGAAPDAVDRSGKVALIYAAGRGFPDIVGDLLAAGANADRAWGRGLTPLMWAAGHANDAPQGDGIEVARLLMDAGADVSRRDDRGRDALMIAAERGHAGMVALLVERGANPAAVDREGRKAADLATTDEIRELLRRSE